MYTGTLAHYDAIANPKLMESRIHTGFHKVRKPNRLHIHGLPCKSATKFSHQVLPLMTLRNRKLKNDLYQPTRKKKTGHLVPRL